MATKICVFNMLPAEKDVIRVRLPFGGGSTVLTFSQGDQVVAETLEAGSRDVYTGALVTSVANDEPAILVNQGVYKDEDGNRTGLVDNVGRVTYKSGEIVTCVRPSKNMPLQISFDAISGSPSVGKLLVPQLGSAGYSLVVADSTTGTVSYKIESVTDKIAVGNTLVSTVLVRTK